MCVKIVNKFIWSHYIAKSSHSKYKNERRKKNTNTTEKLTISRHCFSVELTVHRPISYLHAYFTFSHVSFHPKIVSTIAQPKTYYGTHFTHTKENATCVAITPKCKRHSMRLSLSFCLLGSLHVTEIAPTKCKLIHTLTYRRWP